jgi:hypothetical protein
MALAVIKVRSNFNSIAQRVQNVHRFEYFAKIQSGRGGGHIGFLQKIKTLKYSTRRVENPHQISIRSLKDFNSCIDLNILLIPRWPPWQRYWIL